MRELIAVIIVVLMAILFNYLIERAEKGTKEIQIGLAFSGTVLEKNSHRGYGITILKSDKEKFQIAIASDCLYNHVSIGDTIIKLPNSNKCMVKGDSSYQCDCYYFSADNK